MTRYLRLYRVLWENSFARETEFRANFWANVVTNTGWLLFFVAFVKVIYLNTQRVAGWTEGEAMVLTGTYGAIQGIFAILFYQNLSRLPELIRLGTLDFVVTKPVSAQFMVSARYVKLDSIGNVFGAVAVIAYGISLARAAPEGPGIAGYLYLCLCALALYYSVYMLVMCLAFWFIRVENLAVLSDMVFHIGRYPVDIFRGWIWSLFVYVIPLAFVASFPARALFGHLAPYWFFVGTLLTVTLFAASILFWRYALRNYSSASS